MSLTLNMVGGGGGKLKDTDAVLFVTVPTGSSVIATKGAITLTPTIWTKNADNTLDCAVFIISPSLFDAQNAWTVTSTLGTNSASKTVTIDAADEYEMELYYKLYLFKAGDTSGWTSKAWRSSSDRTAHAPSISYGTTAMTISQTSNHSGVAYHEAVDLTNYSVVIAKGTFTARVVFENGLYVLSNLSGTYYVNASASDTLSSQGATDTKFEIDVSNLSGYYYVAFGLARNSNVNATFVVTEAYLE